MKLSLAVGVAGVALGASAIHVPQENLERELLGRLTAHWQGLCAANKATSQEYELEQKCMCTKLVKDSEAGNWFGLKASFAMAQSASNACWRDYFLNFGKEYCARVNPTESFFTMDANRPKC